MQYHQKQDAKSYVVNYWREFFRKIDARYLTVPACNETCLVHTVPIDLEDPLVFYTTSIRGHNTFACLVPYLLLVHVGKFFFDSFSSFCVRVCIGMAPGFGEGIGFFRYKLGVSVHHSQIDEKI